MKRIYGKWLKDVFAAEKVLNEYRLQWGYANLEHKFEGTLNGECFLTIYLLDTDDGDGDNE